MLKRYIEWILLFHVIGSSSNGKCDVAILKWVPLQDHFRRFILSFLVDGVRWCMRARDILRCRWNPDLFEWLDKCEKAPILIKDSERFQTITERPTLFSLWVAGEVVGLVVRVWASRGTLEGELRGLCGAGLANNALILSPSIAFNGDTVNKSATKILKKCRTTDNWNQVPFR